MEQDIKTIPLEEMLDDLVESGKDVERCSYYLALPYRIPVEQIQYTKRKEVNEEVIEKIKTEIKRRVESSE